MKTIQAGLLCVCVISLSALVTVSGHSVNSVLTVDEYFDSYGDVSWEEEKVHLDNLGIALQRDSDMIGYIIVYAGQRACLGEAQDRALRAKQYVVQIHGIEESRVISIDGGHREKLTTVLQPIERGAPKLTPTPTIDLCDVHIIKNCKPKTIKNNTSRSPRPSHKQRRPCQ